MPMSDYHISDEDIAAVLRFLEIHDPENATEKNARDFLHNIKAGVHDLALEKPEALVEIYESLKKKN